MYKFLMQRLVSLLPDEPTQAEVEDEDTEAAQDYEDMCRAEIIEDLANWPAKVRRA